MPIFKKKSRRIKPLTRGKIAKKPSKSAKRIIDQKTIEYGFGKYHKFVIRKDGTETSRDDYIFHSYSGDSNICYIKLSMYNSNNEEMPLSFPNKLDFRFVNSESRAKITLCDWDIGRDDIYNIKQYGSLSIDMSMRDTTAFGLMLKGANQDTTPIITASI